MTFEKDIFYGFLIQGNLTGALDYLSQFPEEAHRLQRYDQLFAQPVQYEIAPELQRILDAYQLYYRDAFYLAGNPERAEESLLSRLAEILDTGASLDEMEMVILPPLFQREGLHFLGGRTGGFRGPYIWRSMEECTYPVELPEGVQTYTLRLYRNFLTKSWLDYLSFGEVSPGGWAGTDGVLNCIADSYDLESEAFQVSLLKHEAQHIRDLQQFPDMSQEDLEYRAKLVELIYSRERDLLSDFRAQAGDANGHARAAKRLCREFAGITDRAEIPKKARELLVRSNEKLDIHRYWSAVLAQDAAELREFFAPDAYVNWHNTNEHFTVEEFIRANCEYPGQWAGEIEQMLFAENTVITAVHVYTQDKTLSFHVTSFIRLQAGKIASIDEYWGDDGPAPGWRQDMKIGRRIRENPAGIH